MNHWKWRNNGHYECIYNVTCWVYLSHYLFRQLILPSLKSSCEPYAHIYRLFKCPCGQRDTLRTTLVSHSARVRHIRVITAYVTWHVLWRKQWTLTTGIMVVVTIGVKPAHLEFSDSTMGPVLWEFHYLLIIFSVAEAREFLLVLQLQRQQTVFLIISVIRITSILEWVVTKFKSVQIYCSEECNELC